jgi:hypothetical protein
MYLAIFGWFAVSALSLCLLSLLSLAALGACHVISFRLLCPLGAESCGATAVVMCSFNMGDFKCV